MTVDAIPVLAPDVIEFYRAHRGVFGAMNLLPDHLPSDDRIIELACGVMTVDYAIGRAFDVPLYLGYLESFAKETERSCRTVGLGESNRDMYRRHLTELHAMDGATLALELRRSAKDTMESFNLFLPKQCNLSCRGCYAAAVPVGRHPYHDELVTNFFDGAASIIEQAKQCGARTIYTSGDGEPTIFPRFFDLLELLRTEGMQWLFFTAGLVFSSEMAAAAAWKDARTWLRGPSRERIAGRLTQYMRDEMPDPHVRALTAELAEYREQVQIYHSIWSVDAEQNTGLRRPTIGDYRYESVESRGYKMALPSSLTRMMREIFTGDLRGRLGVEMPVSDVGVHEVPKVAAFVVDNGLRSYFEPTIFTGRNRLGDLGDAPAPALATVAPLLVRTLCGFRNIHQPTIKYHQTGTGGQFVASPGMGVDPGDLRSMGVLEPLAIDDRTDAFFAAVHSPLMAYANYVHITGCKCNDFAAEMVRDRAGVAARWREISSSLDSSAVSLAALVKRLSYETVA